MLILYIIVMNAIKIKWVGKGQEEAGGGAMGGQF